MVLGTNLGEKNLLKNGFSYKLLQNVWYKFTGKYLQTLSKNIFQIVLIQI